VRFTYFSRIFSFNAEIRGNLEVLTKFITCGALVSGADDMATKISRFKVVENTFWTKEVNRREKTFIHKKALSHKKVWGKRKP